MRADLDALLRRAMAFDRSWTFAEDGGVDRRTLFFHAASPADAALLQRAALALGLDAEAVALWRAHLPGSDALGLTVNAAGSSVRLYTQHWQALAARVEAGDLSPFPLYRGFKRLAGGLRRDDVYHCLPLAPRAEFWPEIATALANFGLPVARMETIFAPLTPEACIWTRTAGAGRRSWLATLRRADLDQAALADALDALPPRPGLAEVTASLRNARLLHLAGGEDATKGRFLTFYTEATAAEVADFLTA